MFELLLKNRGFILHSSASISEDEAFVFVGSSGAGKSTSAKLLKEEYPRLNDDKSIIRKVNNNYFCYQNSFREKYEYRKNPEIDARGYKVSKLFFLRKSNDFKMEKIADKDLVLKKILKQVLNSGQIPIGNAMKFVSSFDNFYYLYFAKDKKRMIRFFKSISEKA
jgi:hypothetical protein